MKKYTRNTDKLKAKNKKREEKLEQRRQVWRELYSKTNVANNSLSSPPGFS
jgi:hypothetical protein